MILNVSLDSHDRYQGLNKKERRETEVIVVWSMMDLEGAGKERERKGDTEQ